MRRFAARFLSLSLLVACAAAVVPAVAVDAVATGVCREIGGAGCRIGRTGPGGGTIFFDAGAARWWGRWLEARPLRTDGVPWSLNPTTSIFGADAAVRAVIDHKGIGYGALNTALIVAQNGPGRYAASIVDRHTGGGKFDWFLPSTDELALLYDRFALTGRPAMRRVPYWSSSENSANFAWYQLFQDGTRFTDENQVGKVTSNKGLRRMPIHGKSGFGPHRFGLVAVRAFGPRSGSQPVPTAPVETGNVCTESGPCAIGDTGPGGGIVFYDAGKHQPWGRWLELAPEDAEYVGFPWRTPGFNDRVRPLYVDGADGLARHKRVLSKAIGAGMANTRRIIRMVGKGEYAAWLARNLDYGGKTDWFLPSEYELAEAHRNLFTAVSPIGGMSRSFYWSSSEYDFDNAWTVNMKDGQTFDRLKRTVPNEETGLKAIRTRAVRAFG